MPSSYMLSHALTISGAHKNAHSKRRSLVNDESPRPGAGTCRVRPALTAVRSGMGLVEMFQGRQFLDGLAGLGLGHP
jgi:hypothetical protein